MCTFADHDREPAEQQLADLMNQHLPGCAVMPADLQTFIREHWRHLSVYAHRIHNGHAFSTKDASR
jgi:hypothetical protein